MMRTQVLALVGAALVAVGLLLVGVRQTKAGEWNPAMSSISVEVAG